MFWNRIILKQTSTCEEQEMSNAGNNNHAQKNEKEERGDKDEEGTEESIDIKSIQYKGTVSKRKQEEK